MDWIIRGVSSCRCSMRIDADWVNCMATIILRTICCGSAKAVQQLAYHRRRLRTNRVRSRPAARAWVWAGFHALLGLMCLLAAAGCGPKPKPPPPTLRVVVGSYLLADLVRQMGGDLVEVRWAAESGQPYERFVPGGEFLQSLREADLVIVGGEDELWFAEQTDPAFQPDRHLNLARLRGGDEVAGALWMDPRVALAMIDPLTTRLIARRPEMASVVRERANHLRRRLETLAGEVASHGGGRTVLCFDHRFDPLLLAGGYQPHRVECQAVAPRDVDVQLVRSAAAATGARALIVSADLPPAAIEEWGRRTGLRIVPLEALGRPGGGGYEATQRENLRQLRKGALSADDR